MLDRRPHIFPSTHLRQAGRLSYGEPGTASIGIPVSAKLRLESAQTFQNINAVF
jgi:hypothetical protein